jgi:hypothetical protein
MTFNQSNWHVNKVYNIGGDLHLTEQSGPADFVAAVEELRARARALENVPAPERAALDQELAEVAALGELDDAESAGPAEDAEADAEGTDDAADAGDSTRSGRAVRGLARVGALLRGLTGAATAANELGVSVDELAQWAGHHL